MPGSPVSYIVKKRVLSSANDFLTWLLEHVLLRSLKTLMSSKIPLSHCHGNKTDHRIEVIHQEDKAGVPRYTSFLSSSYSDLSFYCQCTFS